MDQKTKMKKTAFALTMVAGMAFGGIMAEKAYSSSIQAQQGDIKLVSIAKERAMTIKDQLDPRKWDFHKRFRVGLSIGMLLGTLFILVKNVRDTEMEMKAEREKNKPSS